MARIVVSEASGLVIDGEIVAWDWEQEKGIALVAGQQYRVFGRQSRACVVMEDRDAARFQHTANMALVVFRCPFCVGKLDDREQVLCSACSGLVEGGER